MDDRNLFKKFKFYKAELLALKTAHERGLGVAKFVSATGSVSFSMYDVIDAPILTITVQFLDDFTQPPYCQVGISTANKFSFNSATWDSDAGTLVFKFTLQGASQDGVQADVKAISSAQIQSLGVEKGSS